jgi:CBS-domain-containing membrane protein
LVAFGRLTGEGAVGAMAVVDATGGLVGEIVAETSHFISALNDAKGGTGGTTALSMSAGALAASMHRHCGSKALPTCTLATPLHELLATFVEAKRGQVWVVDAESMPMGMVTAAAMMGAIRRAAPRRTKECVTAVELPLSAKRQTCEIGWLSVFSSKASRCLVFS